MSLNLTSRASSADPPTVMELSGRLLRQYPRLAARELRPKAHALLLRVKENPSARGYGNAFHQANTILGLAALDGGNIEEAVHYMMASARTPGSRQLCSLGPNMLLAQRLLRRGRRKEVIAYLNACRSFWKCSLATLWKWKAQIRLGDMPNFGPNLSHLLDPKTFG
jgi:hypothetical protein